MCHSSCGLTELIKDVHTRSFKARLAMHISKTDMRLIRWAFCSRQDTLGSRQDVADPETLERCNVKTIEYGTADHLQVVFYAREEDLKEGVLTT